VTGHSFTLMSPTEFSVNVCDLEAPRMRCAGLNWAVAPEEKKTLC
jgi:hypothetical protein